MSLRLVPSVVLERDATQSVARIAQVLTLYIHDMAPWEHGGAEAACRELLAVCAVDNFKWFTTSRLEVWYRIEPSTVAEVLSNLTWDQVKPRHCFGFWLADDSGAPHCAFSYRSVDTKRSGRAGYVQLVLPQDADPGLLWQLALSLGHRFPFTCGIGGFGATWNRRHPRTAFHEIRAWCRRYIGLDVQEPERMSWHVVDSLPGTNWLTLVGPSALDRRQERSERLLGHTFRTEGAIAVPLEGGGVVVRAGHAPTFADLNRFEYPRAYVEVARLFEEWLPEAPTPFTGGFYVHEDTSAWMRRFVDPETWR